MRGTEAMDLIRDQMAKSKDDYVSMMGEVMTEYLRMHPDAEIGEDRTLKGAFDHLKAEAKKKQKGGCYAMPPKEIFDGMMAYYGLTPEDGDGARCFATALGQSTPDPVEPMEPVKPAKDDDLFDIDALLGL